MSAIDSERMLNEKSGLLGLSGISSDMREILQAADGGNDRARIALTAYCNRVRKGIGSYVAAMVGADEPLSVRSFVRCFDVCVLWGGACVADRRVFGVRLR